MTLGDRLMVLSGGYVEQFGTPIELYENPASIFVAGFIGGPAMNFLSCRIDASGMVRLENGAILPSMASANDKVTLGLRPEHLIADQAGPGACLGQSAGATGRQYSGAWGPERQPKQNCCQSSLSASHCIGF